MSTMDQVLNSSNNENTCVVCFKDVDIFSIGRCDHPVCYECSTRMRILCGQNECPICRQDLPKVVFHPGIVPFKQANAAVQLTNMYDKNSGIWFANNRIKNAYYALLEHSCSICQDMFPFKTFKQLKEHMRREHELHYCDICVENLKIFTWERKCYTRSALVQHRRKGDLDDTSHRGHPLCKFCDVRYMDQDELFRHLRRDHFFCHFCDADGLHQYYLNYEDLKKHFQAEHFICEEGECIHEQFTAVFRTKNDLKAHRALVHGKNLSKAENKQARTLELEFSLTPRPYAQFNRNRRPNQNNNEEEEAIIPPPKPVAQNRSINTFSNEEFPTLGGAPIVMMPLSGPSSSGVTIRHFKNKQSLTRNDANFPALANNDAGSTLSLSVNNTSRSAASSGTTNVRPQGNVNNVSIHLNHRPNSGITTRISQSGAAQSKPRSASEAFPALGSAHVPDAQWLIQPKVKVKAPPPEAPKEPPPKPVPPTSIDDFPSLGSGRGKKAVPEPPDLNSSKTKKKKAKSTAAPAPTYSASASKVVELPKKQNGVVKKRTELKIDKLQISELQMENEKAFPTLGAKRPPPGFSKQPPPGFGNSLTFTSSSGESYPILPSFHQPPNFPARNRSLVERVMAVLDRPEAINEFKQSSSDFRNGLVTAASYYGHCKAVMGRQFQQIFPELLALLPDIGKQQELHAIHSKSPGSKGLEVCAVCNQVVLAKDMKHHAGVHS